MKPLNNPTLLLVRHGATTMNENPKRFRGMDDPPLNEDGVKQAHEAAERVGKYPLHHIYHSALKRTARTAQIISKHTDAQTTPTKALDPWDYGELTGKEITPERLKEMKSYQDAPQMKTPGGESYEDFYKRFAGGLKSAKDFVHEHPEKALALVTHSRNLYPLRHILGENVDIPTHETPTAKGGGMPGYEEPGSVWKVEWKGGKHTVSRA